jgi:hypothetical protein
VRATVSRPRAVQSSGRLAEGDIFVFMMTYHLQFVRLGLAGWVNRYQQTVIDSSISLLVA